MDMNLMIGTRHDLDQNPNNQQHSPIPDQRQTAQTSNISERDPNPTEDISQNPSAQNNAYLPGANYNFNSNVGYQLNIPSTRSLDGERSMDMTKYSNMGYTGTDIGFQRTTPYTRSDLNFARSTPTTAIQTLPQTSVSNNQNLPSANLVMRYSDPNMMNMSYKQMNATNANMSSQLSSLNRSNILQTVRSTSETMVNRLPQPLDVSSGYKSADVALPRANYNTSSLDMDQSLNLRGNIGNLSHIVDRFQSDDRMLGLQPTAQAFYPEKTLAPAHMLSKPIATSASALPMFTQPNISIAYRDNIQVNNSLYGRQMTELQNANPVMQQEKAVPLPQVQEKKTKKRKSTKTGNVELMLNN